MKLSKSVLSVMLSLAAGPVLAQTVPPGEPYNDYINNGMYYGSHAGALTLGTLGTLCCGPIIGAGAGVAGSDLGGWAGGELGVYMYGNDTFGSYISEPPVFTYDPPSEIQDYGSWMGGGSVR